MDWCEANRRAALRTAVVGSCRFRRGCFPRLRRGGCAGDIVLRYAPKEGEVLKYKGSTTNEAFFQGNEFMNVHSDIVEISLVKMTEDGKYDVKLNYLESADKRGMAGSALVRLSRARSVRWDGDRDHGRRHGKGPWARTGFFRG